MTPRILLIGKSGQVGRELSRLLPSLGELVALDRRQLDLTRRDDIRDVIRAICPNIIVNAAAYTAVDKAETNEAMAHAINADAPGVIADEAKAVGAALVHYSTDYVFDGSKNIPYEEEDPTEPINSYGRTKLAGEKAIQQSGVAHLIFRTAWVYAKEGHNFLLTILRLATQREELKIVDDQFGAPTSSREIAVATTHILAQFCTPEFGLLPFTKRCGIYHMTAAGETNWHGFAAAILEETMCRDVLPPWIVAATNQLPLIARRVIPIHTDEYPTPARRPAHSVLSNHRLAQTFGTYLPQWRTQLHSMFSED